jgi:hypothetical protein
MAHPVEASMRLPLSPLEAQATVAVLMVCGAWVLCWGLPRADRYRLPWRWRVGILYLGLGLIFWPGFYFFFGHVDLEMVWIPIWIATVLTFFTGIKRLLMANVYAPGGSFHHPDDLGWLLRLRSPRGAHPSASELLQDSVESLIEDQSNPLAPILRFHRRQAARPQHKPDDNST